MIWLGIATSIPVHRLSSCLRRPLPPPIAQRGLTRLPRVRYLLARLSPRLKLLPFIPLFLQVFFLFYPSRFQPCRQFRIALWEILKWNLLACTWSIYPLFPLILLQLSQKLVIMLVGNGRVVYGFHMRCFSQVLSVVTKPFVRGYRRFFGIGFFLALHPPSFP